VENIWETSWDLRICLEYEDFSEWDFTLWKIKHGKLDFLLTQWKSQRTSHGSNDRFAIDMFARGNHWINS